jgi:hypothetical protein
MLAIVLWDLQMANMNQGGQLQVAMLQQQYVCLILSCLVSIYLSKKILGCMTMIDCQFGMHEEGKRNGPMFQHEGNEDCSEL